MEKCCKCTQDSEYTDNGISFCRPHYVEHLEYKLFKRIKQAMFKKNEQYYLQNSDFVEIAVNALLKYYKIENNFFHNLVLDERCQDFSGIISEHYGFDIHLTVGVPNNLEQIIALPGQLLAVDTLSSVSYGNFKEAIEYLQDGRNIFLLEDLSVADCELLTGKKYDSLASAGPAMRESSLNFRNIINCMKRINLG